MNEKLHHRLKELDSGEHWERPPSFNYFRSLGEVAHLKPYAENILETYLQLDTQVQDASYFTALESLDPRYYDPKKGGALVELIGIRFSAFDRMVTIFGTELGKWEAKIPVLNELLLKRGYLVVPHEELEIKYDGIHTRGTENWTWYTRFFDYL
jgi:hypothetical protein